MEKVQQLDNETFQKLGKAEIKIQGEGTWKIFKDRVIIPRYLGSKTIKYDVTIKKCIVGQRLEIRYSKESHGVMGDISKGVVTEILV